jgi:hypothetical protein
MKRAVVNKERVLMEWGDVLIQFSLTDEDFSQILKFEKYAFGLRLRIILLSQKMKEIKGGVDFFRECDFKYNDLC